MEPYFAVTERKPVVVPHVGQNSLLEVKPAERVVKDTFFAVNLESCEDRLRTIFLQLKGKRFFPKRYRKLVRFRQAAFVVHFDQQQDRAVLDERYTRKIKDPEVFNDPPLAAEPAQLH